MAYDYLSMLGLKSIHISKRGPSSPTKSALEPTKLSHNCAITHLIIEGTGWIFYHSGYSETMFLFQMSTNARVILARTWRIVRTWWTCLHATVHRDGMERCAIKVMINVVNRVWVPNGTGLWTRYWLYTALSYPAHLNVRRYHVFSLPIARRWPTVSRGHTSGDPFNNLDKSQQGYLITDIIKYAMNCFLFPWYQCYVIPILLTSSLRDKSSAHF